MIIDFYNRGGGGDMSDYYTKEDINALIADFVTASTDDLVNYYLKSETYTQAEIEQLVGQITSFEVVAELPVSDIKTNVIYLLGPIGSGSDRYEEYIYSNNTWVKIGETSVDLSNYVTVNQLNTALGFYTTTLQLDLLLQAKQDTLTAGERINISTQNVISADSQIISLTQAEYDALGTNIDPDMVYVITDASPVVLATVATTGSYNDLTDKPALSTVATSGAYADLSGTPTLATVATSGSYNDLTNTPTLATVATTGDYDDLTNKPTIPVVPTLATVATSGSYNDLTDKPTIPVVPTLATVATTGAYADLTGTPTIPTVGTGTVTLTQGGTTIGTFGLNDSADKTIEIPGGTQVQADWNETNTSSKAYIQNKPDVRPVLDLSTLRIGLFERGEGTVYDLWVYWATSYQGKYDFYWGDSKVTKIVNTKSSAPYAPEFYFDVTNDNTSVTTTRKTINAITGGWTTKTYTFTTPTLATVATSGSYNDLTDKPTIPVVPTLATVATTGAYADLTGTPTLATVATSGSYNDLTDKPSIPVVPTLATVATTGDYDDLTSKPTLATVATSGAYADLTGTPVLGTANLVFTLADSSVVTYTVYISTISQQ